MRSAVLFLGVLFPILLASCRERTAASVSASAGAPATPAAVRVAEAVPAPPPPTPEELEAGAAALRERAVLMHAIFGTKFNPAANEASIEMRAPDEPDMSMYTIEPVAHAFLPNGDAALVANALIVRADRDGIRVHTDGGLLNVFILRQADGRWTLLKHHANVARLGTWERIGTAKFMHLAPGKPGLAMLYGSAFQGYVERYLSLFDLGAADLRDLTGDGIALSASALACEPADTETCYDVTSGWRFAVSASGAAYNDLVFQFRGEEDSKKDVRRKGAEGPRLASDITRLDGAARYAYDGKTYVLVEGKNLAKSH
ncbi:hypothetical protein CR152_00870 [Massilia violaceinigra]|uniref:Lipoprotein n=1 Tax=Massilia violaceinigra TaxID=2045208 RepID=A0A2D2DE72_9BURK|nr:hypothetical protein [Massilia violaceinigra]ATQ73219.1 hypothetical protein CR152_00870 [Massilia violaceinigra]